MLVHLHPHPNPPPNWGGNKKKILLRNNRTNRLCRNAFAATRKAELFGSSGFDIDLRNIHIAIGSNIDAHLLRVW